MFVGGCDCDGLVHTELRYAIKAHANAERRCSKSTPKARQLALPRYRAKPATPTVSRHGRSADRDDDLGVFIILNAPPTASPVPAAGVLGDSAVCCWSTRFVLRRDLDLGVASPGLGVPRLGCILLSLGPETGRWGRPRGQQFDLWIAAAWS